MFFLNKSFLYKFILWLFLLAALIGVIYFSINQIRNNIEKKEQDKQIIEFLDYVENGDINNCRALWPSVFTVNKNNMDFLDDFSQTLYELYTEFYTSKYYNNEKSNSLFEIARLYHSFIYDDAFNTVTSAVYDDFIYENITYQTFLAAINDFFLFSEYKSPHITILLDEAALLNYGRNTYFKALENAAAFDYQTAIQLMRKVAPRDTVYYPKSIEKINEFILKLKEKVSNGS